MIHIQSCNHCKSINVLCVHWCLYTYYNIQYQAVSQMLADMAIGIEASRLLVYKSAWEADQGLRNTYHASIAKALASDVANKAATDAVQVINSEFLQVFCYPVMSVNLSAWSI